MSPAIVTTQANVVRYGQSLLTFDKKAEARLRLKIDLYIIPTVAILYLFCFIDRANIGKLSRSSNDRKLTCPGNARLAGFEKDLALKGYDYNTVLSVFYISRSRPPGLHCLQLTRFEATLCSKFPAIWHASGLDPGGSSLPSRSALAP